MKKVLVVSVHPDDETLGCGGTLLKHYHNGDKLYWLILTAPSKSRGYSDEFISDRKKQIANVAVKYNFEKVIELNHEAGGLYDVDETLLISSISDAVTELQPHTVYTVNRSDVHSDHRIAFDAVISATKSFRYPFIKKLLMYECISETEMAPPLEGNIFSPNVFVDISDYLNEKINIMKIYESEIQQQPMPRSIENIRALATFRGSTVAVKYAEAFMLLRQID